MDEQVRAILDEVGGLVVPAAGVAVDQDLFVVGLTSFATVTVMLAIEDAFDVEFPDERLNRATFRSIASLCAVIDELKGDRVAA